MLVILEGVDGSGKSTLVDDFLLQLGDSAVTLHRGPIKTHPMHEYVHALRAYQPTTDKVVCDRWHVGELVYGPLYRGESKLTSAMETYVELFLTSRGALKLWVDTPFETVRVRLATRGEDFLQEQHLRLVWDFYRDHLPIRGWRSVSGKEQKQKRAELVADLITRAKRLCMTAPSTYWPGYVGPLNPRVLLVGNHHLNGQDRPNFGPLPWVPYEGSPGHYLMTAVASQRDFPRYGLVNPLQFDSDFARGFVGNLEEKPVFVAFGEKVASRLKTLGYDRIVVMQDPARGTQSPFTVSRYGEFLLERIRRA